MNYTQTYSIQELQTDGRSRAVQICFVVADSYTEVFTSTGVSQHDLVQFDSIKQDLNLENGDFAVDELQFTVQSASVMTPLDETILNFMLAASDTTVKRYVGVFLGEDGGNPVNLGNLLFLGTISPELSGTDVHWRSSAPYSQNTAPVRDWQFSALSFQMTVLDAIDPYADVLDNASPTTLAAMNAFGEMVPVYGQATVKNFQDGIGWRYTTQGPISPWIRLFPNQSTIIRGYMVGVNLFNFLQALVKLSEPIIQAKFGVAMQVNVTASATLLRGNVPQYILSPDVNKPFQIENVQPGGVAYNAAIREAEEFNVGGETLSIKPLYVDFAMCYPEYANAANITPSDVAQLPKFTPPQKHPFYTKNTENIERIGVELSYKRFKSVSSLLFAIARALGAYLRFRLLTPTSLQIAFEPRNNVIGSGEVRLRDAVSAQLSTSPFAESSSKNENDNTQRRYTGQTTSYTLDALDTTLIQKFAIENPALLSGGYQKGSHQGWQQSERFDTQPAGETLLHSTGWALATLKSDTVQPTYLQNLIFAGTKSGETYSAGYALPLFIDALFTHPGMLVNTGLFIQKSDAASPTGNVLLPLGALTVKVNGEDLFFPSLAWYISWLDNRDGAFYKTEYQIEVPYLTQFSKNADGSSPSWKHINLSTVLGPRIKFIENGIDQFFTVVGVEWKLQNASVVLRLHNASRFAFATPTANVGGATTIIKKTSVFGAADSAVKEYELRPGQKVRKGDAVLMWTIPIFNVISVIRAEPDAVHAAYGKYLGIALNNADGDDPDAGKRRLAVQESGIAELGDLHPSVTLTLGARLYVRLFDATAYTNVSNNMVNPPNTNEHVIQFIGTVNTITPPTIRIDKNEVSSIFYEYYPN